MTFFKSTRPGETVTYGEATFELPILYFRDDFFGLYFSADAKKVSAIMPSNHLHPLLLPNGRAIIAVTAYNYIDTTIGPYGEIPIVIPAVYREIPSRLSSIRPLLQESNYPKFGVLVQHLPVTKVIARDAGRGEWGYTKFVADMVFRATPEYFRCYMTEKDTHILDLHVHRNGIRLKDKKPLTTYSVKNNQLIKTVIPQCGFRHVNIFPAGCYVSWGDHPVAESVLNLDISAKPFMSFYYTQRSAILPSGHVIEDNVRTFDGFIGESREAVHSTMYTDYDI